VADAPCPACGGPPPFERVESHHDRVGGRDYVLYLCKSCGVTFSEPREAVGPEWYEKAAPLRGKEARGLPAGDWRFRQFFADRVPPGRLLDVGCGDGGFLALAKDRGFRVSGFDYDERVAARARARGLEDVRAEELSRFLASRRPGEFDVITLFDALEHVPEPGRLVDDLLRLLVPGGRIAITLPNALRPLLLGREEHDYPPHHFTRWTPRAMRRFLEGKGFVIERQSADHLRLEFLSDHVFFYSLMPRALAAAKKILFRGAAREGASVTQLYAEGRGEGRLADPARRQALVDATRDVFRVLFLPAAWLWRARIRARQPDCGDCLYTLARRA